jgi:hypothetical protein
MARVGAPAPNGPTQIFVEALPASTLSAGSPAGASFWMDVDVPAPVTGVGVPIAVQVQPLGQTLSSVQVVAFGRQEPG